MTALDLLRLNAESAFLFGVLVGVWLPALAVWLTPSLSCCSPFGECTCNGRHPDYGDV